MPTPTSTTGALCRPSLAPFATRQVRQPTPASSIDGDLLCSMAGAPDNVFTVWNWRESRIMLRAKSSGQDVFSAAFSSYMPGSITSAGSAHVRFWRMALTFTGLKLEGAQGRFGNTEVSDVIGVLSMPDGKVGAGTGCSALPGAGWGTDVSSSLNAAAGRVGLRVGQHPAVGGGAHQGRGHQEGQEGVPHRARRTVRVLQRRAPLPG